LMKMSERRVSSRKTKGVAPSRFIEEGKKSKRPKKARLVRSPTPEFAATPEFTAVRPIKPRLVRRPIKPRLVRSPTPEFTAVRPIKPRLVRSPTPEVAAVRSPTPEVAGLVRSPTPEVAAVRSPTPEVAAVRSPTPEVAGPTKPRGVRSPTPEIAVPSPAQAPEREEEEDDDDKEEPDVPEQQEAVLETDEEKKALVKRMYSDVNFSACYAGTFLNFERSRSQHIKQFYNFLGITAMQRELFLQKGVHVSRTLVQEALREVENYILHLLPKRKFDQARIVATSYGETVQADLAEMFSKGSFNYYFLAVDCFSRRIFTTALRRKTNEEVKVAIENVISSGNMTISTLQTDQGNVSH
jgi:hypothetical protein